MTEKKVKFHKWFHKFLVNFAMWAFGAFAILFGIQYIFEAKMDGYSGSEFMMILIVNVLLIAVGLFTFKTRFGLNSLVLPLAIMLIDFFKLLRTLSLLTPK